MNWTAFKELTPAIVQECADSFIDLNKKHGSVTKGTLIILSDMALQKGGIIPSDATAFNRVPWLNCQILGDWAPDRVDLDGFMENWVDGLGDRIAKIELNNPDIPAEEKRAGKYAYWNASNGKTPASVVFGGNYERLRKLKKKYDPHSVFNKWYPIEPAE
jgi:FAD/FMN-containing dehydrogenase